MADNTRVMMQVRSANVITVPIDDTLSVSGEAADAKAVGDALALKADASSVVTISVNGESADNQGAILINGSDIPLTGASGAPTIAAAVQNISTGTAATIPMSSQDSTTIAEKISAMDTAAAGNVKSVNSETPNVSGNVVISSVPFANNLTSDSGQSSAAEFVWRTTGGSRSVKSGSATLQEIRGVSVHTGYSPEVLNWNVVTTAGIVVTFDRDTFLEAVTGDTTKIFTYNGGTSSWSSDPTAYGFTVTGTPADEDTITVTYVAEVRGTISVATPTDLVSTGWNLFNYSTGYARVVEYEGNYHVGGTYTSLKFSATLSGTQSAITVVNGSFTVPGDGYVWVEGGNATDTYITTEWTDWVTGPDVAWAAYSESKINIASIMTSYFPYGLMAVGAIYDSIDLAALQPKAISRIERLAYTAENLADVIDAGRAYEYDSDYIYAVRTSAVENNITLSGAYTVSDHGLEIFNGTTTPAFAVVLYGQDLKAKLTNDVLTISQQTLTTSQKKQVLQNLGAFNSSGVLKVASGGTGATSASAARTALGAQAALSVETTTVTGKGMTMYLYRYGKIVFFSLASGNRPSSNVSADTTIMTLPSGWRPAGSVYQLGVHGGWSSSNWVIFQIGTDGAFKCKSALSSGSATAVAGSFVCA